MAKKDEYVVTDELEQENASRELDDAYVPNDGGSKRIEVVQRPVGELGTSFGNPRKITNARRDKLRESLESFGDFGIFIIDENEEIIGGNQRASVLCDIDPSTVVTCKKLIGYSDAEKRAINIRDNTHSGEWDFDLLSDWTADLTIDLGLHDDFDDRKKDVEDRRIKDMELIHYEKYDYVLLACRNENDYNQLVDRLGLRDRMVSVCSKRKIKARAVWYDKVADKLFGGNAYDASLDSGDEGDGDAE